MIPESVPPTRPDPQNPATLEDPLKFSLRDGKVHTLTGVRAVLATGDFITCMQTGLTEQLGTAADSVLYRAGFKWGWQDMHLFVPLMERQKGKKIQEMGAGEFLAMWWKTLQAQGWGRWQVDMSQRKHGLLLVGLQDSAVVRCQPAPQKPVCHIYTGLFAGMFSYLTRTELTGIELSCATGRESACQFLVGTAKRINAARNGLAEGATAQQAIALAVTG